MHASVGPLATLLVFLWIRSKKVGIYRCSHAYAPLGLREFTDLMGRMSVSPELGKPNAINTPCEHVICASLFLCLYCGFSKHTTLVAIKPTPAYSLVIWFGFVLCWYFKLWVSWNSINAQCNCQLNWFCLLRRGNSAEKLGAINRRGSTVCTMFSKTLDGDDFHNELELAVARAE